MDSFGELLATVRKPAAKTPEVDELLSGEHAPKIRKFFDAVKWAEGGEPDLIVGGKQRFDPAKDHPNVVGLTTPEGPSTAAGDYQITGSNWYGKKGVPGLKQKIGAKDFTPENQLKAAITLFKERDGGRGLQALLNDDYDTALEIARKDWAALPGSKLHKGRNNTRKYEDFMSRARDGGFADLLKQIQPTEFDGLLESVRVETLATTPIDNYGAPAVEAQKQLEGSPVVQDDPVAKRLTDLDQVRATTPQPPPTEEQMAELERLGIQAQNNAIDPTLERQVNVGEFLGAPAYRFGGAGTPQRTPLAPKQAQKRPTAQGGVDVSVGELTPEFDGSRAQEVQSAWTGAKKDVADDDVLQGYDTFKINLKGVPPEQKSAVAHQQAVAAAARKYGVSQDKVQAYLAAKPMPVESVAPDADVVNMEYGRGALAEFFGRDAIVGKYREKQREMLYPLYEKYRDAPKNLDKIPAFENPIEGQYGVLKEQTEREASEALRAPRTGPVEFTSTADWQAAFNRLLDPEFWKSGSAVISQEERNQAVNQVADDMIRTAGDAQTAQRIQQEYEQMSGLEKGVRHAGDFAKTIARFPASFAKTIAWAEDSIGYLREQGIVLPTATPTDLFNAVDWVWSKALGIEPKGAKQGEVPMLLAKAIEKGLPDDPKTANTFVGKISRGLGSAVPFMIGAVASGGSTAVVTLMGIGAQSGEMYGQAQDAGLTREKTLLAGLAGVPLGATEALGLKWAKLGQLINGSSKGVFVRSFTNWLKETGKEATEEALQEYFQSAAGKLTITALKDNGLTRKQVADAMGDAMGDAGIGGLVGAIFGGGVPVVTGNVKVGGKPAIPEAEVQAQTISEPSQAQTTDDKPAVQTDTVVPQTEKPVAPVVEAKKGVEAPESESTGVKEVSLPESKKDNSGEAEKAKGTYPFAVLSSTNPTEATVNYRNASGKIARKEVSADTEAELEQQLQEQFGLTRSEKARGIFEPSDTLIENVPTSTPRPPARRMVIEPKDGGPAIYPESRKGVALKSAVDAPKVRKAPDTPEFKKFFEGAKNLAQQVSQPNTARKLLNDFTSTQDATVARLPSVQRLMLTLAQNDKVFRAVVGLLPVDVVNRITRQKVPSNKLSSDSSVFVNSLRSPISRQDVAALGKVVTGFTTKLGGIFDGTAAKIGNATLSANDFNLREVGGLLAFQRLANLGAGNVNVKPTRASQTTESTLAKGGATEDGSAEFARLIDDFFRSTHTNSIPLTASSPQDEKNILKKARDAESTALLPKLQNEGTAKILSNLKGGKVADNGDFEINEHESEQLRRLLAEKHYQENGTEIDEKSFDAITWGAKTVRGLVELGRDLVTDFKRGGYTDAELKGYNSLLDNLEDSINKAKDYAVAFVFDDALPEEKVHQEDLRAGRTDAEALDTLKSNPLWKGSEKFNRDYSNVTDADRASEIAAKLATDQASNYGFDTIENFEEHKEAFLDAWARGILRKNNIETAEQEEAFGKKFERIYANIKTADKGTASEARRGESSPGSAEKDVRQDAEGKQRKRSLPETLREAGLDAADQYYSVFGNTSETVKATEKLKDLGLADSIKYLENAEVFSKADAILSFQVQAILRDEAAKADFTDTKLADQLRQKALDIGAKHARLATEAGAFNQAAAIVGQTVQGVINVAQSLAQKKKLDLTPAQLQRFEQLGTKGENQLSDLTLLNAENKRLKKELADLKAGKIFSKPVSKKVVDRARAKLPDTKELIKTLKAQLQQRENAPLKSVAKTANPFAQFGASLILDKPINQIDRSQFYREMLKTFGTEIEPELANIFAESFNLRQELLAEARKDASLERLRAEMPGKTDAELSEELKTREKDRKERLASGQMAKTLAKLYSPTVAKQTADLIERVYELSTDDVAANYAEKILTKELKPGEISRSDRKTYAEARDLIAEAKQSIAQDKDAIKEKIAGGAKRLKELENEEFKKRQDIKETQTAVARELRRLTESPLKFYAKEALKIAGETRSVMASGDLSGSLRQGLYFTVTDTGKMIAGKDDVNSAYMTMIKGAVQKGDYASRIKAIEDHPDFPIMVQSGIEFADAGQSGFSLTKAEENIRTEYAKKLPVFKQLLEWSERTYAGFLDQQRALMAHTMFKELYDKGATFKTHPEEFKALGYLINIATGRGQVSNKKLEAAFTAFGNMFFAPSYMVSRFQLVAHVLGVDALKMPPMARRIAYKRVARFHATMTLPLLALAAIGLVSLDPDDDDFLKLKPEALINKIFGTNLNAKARYDFLGGLQPVLRFLGRNAKNAIQAATGQEKVEKSFSDLLYIGGRFLRGKLAPIPSLGVDWATNKDFLGRPFAWDTAAASRLAPLSLKELYQGYNEDGLYGSMMVMPSILGVGVGYYPDREKRAEKVADKVRSGDMSVSDAKTELKKQLDEGKITRKQYKTRIKDLENDTFEKALKTMNAAKDGDFTKIEAFLKEVPDSRMEDARKILKQKRANKLKDNSPKAREDARKLQELITRYLRFSGQRESENVEDLR